MEALLEIWGDQGSKTVNTRTVGATLATGRRTAGLPMTQSSPRQWPGGVTSVHRITSARRAQINLGPRWGTQLLQALGYLVLERLGAGVKHQVLQRTSDQRGKSGCSVVGGVRRDQNGLRQTPQ